MLDTIRKLLDTEAYAPHGYCLTWQPELIWTHVVSDAMIGLAYISIPVTLAYFLQKRRGVQFGWIVWLFAAFIMACAVTHFFSIWTLWNPIYGVEALVKAVTAVVSVATAVALVQLVPRALALPSPADLKRANDELTLRVAERDAALGALERETGERLRAEEMLRQAQKMEAVGQLTSGIAHDFNNMLTAVVGNLDRAKRLAGGDEKLSRSLDGAMAGAERAADLTHQLLAFSRKQPLEPSQQDLNRLIAEMAPLVDRTIGPDIEVVTALASDLWPVEVDANQTESALLNLVVNARDAMPGGGTLRIETRNEADAKGDRVLLEVADTGSGMSPEVAARVFEPFFTTKDVGQGTGLGLSQVYGFVQQSGGQVLLDTAPGQGTRVWLLFPRAG